MHNQEWSLVSFTLLSQFSVGIIVLGGLLFFLLPSQVFVSGINIKSPNLLALLLLFLAVLISLAHLGKPANATNALNNLASSWVSREILALAIFGFFVLLLFLNSYLLHTPVRTSSVLWILGILSGLSLIYVMAKIYSIPVVPSWNTWHTPLSFNLTAFLSGAGFLTILLLANPTGEANYYASKAISFLLILIIILLVAEAFTAISQQLRLMGMHNTGIEKIAFGNGSFFRLFILRILIIAVTLALVILSLMLQGKKSSHSGLSLTLHIISFTLIVLQEIIGRLLFYTSYFRIGI